MIEQSILVAANRERAFRAWTEHVALWWPEGHRISGERDGRMILEGRLNGRFFERTGDGREFEYGRVLAWNPPNALSFTFFPGAGPETPTVVDVTFTAVSEGTLVAIRHRAGELPHDRFDTTAARFEAGWSRVTLAFSHYVSQREV